MHRRVHHSTGRSIAALVIAWAGTAALAAPPVYIEPGPPVAAVRYRDGQPELLQTHTVWRPFCGSDTTNLTVAELKTIAERANAAAAAFPPPAMRLGGPPKFDLIFNITSALPAGAEEALLEVERYIEAQFFDPITVTVNFQFASLPPGVLGSTGSSYTSASFTNTRNGLQADMDGSDSIQTHLPGGASLPVRYDGNSGTVTNESTVFITRANYRAAIGSVSGSAASITFSSNFSWDYTPPAISGGTTCFQSVIVHEVGHALGFVSAADFRPFDVEMLDLYRFQRSDGAGTDHNPDTLAEFSTTARMVDQNAPGTDDDVNSDLISVEWRMSDGNPNQASHFRDNANIGIMDPTIGSGQTFYPNFYRTADLDMFDAIGYDYPHENTSCVLALELGCNDVRHFDNLVLSAAPAPAFSCGVGSAHTGRAWFWFVATAGSANISTCGSPGLDSTWAVYSGTCGSLTEIACSEDDGCGGGGNSSMCVTGLTPGETYYVQFAAKSASARGVYSINVKCSCDGACCVPPPSFCRVLDEQECVNNGGTFVGGGVECPVDDDDLTALCGTLDPVVSQIATGNQEDLSSDVDWSDLAPDGVVADGFRGDGRPIEQIRWWGSVLDPSAVPDGWLVSFHEPLMPADPAGDSLAVYFCGSEVVSSEATSLVACDAEGVIDYTAQLADCCLIHAGIDSRSSLTPGELGAFRAESCVDYSVGIGALVGQRFDLQAGQCVGSSTAEAADGPFWGWHTSVIDTGGTLVRGPVDTSTASLPYGPWNSAVGACGAPNMAVELLTYAQASPIQLAWDTGAPNGQQRLNSQMGGQFTDYLTADDLELSEAASIVALRWMVEEENAFVWQNRVRVEIYPDGGGAPDESGGPTHAYWIPDDIGSVSRTSLGAGTFFPRYRYEVTDLEWALPAGEWWVGLASAASSPTGRTFWLTSRTLSLDGSIIGSQAHFRRPSAGFPTFSPWSPLLAGEQHDMSFEVDVVLPRDCNCNSTLDHIELAGGADDCNNNEVLDECEPDCNENGVADDCDLTAMTSLDCQANGIPDECDLTYEISGDSDADLVPDECDVCPGHSDLIDTDGDQVPDGCDVCPGFDDNLDADLDGVPNDCDNCELANPGQEDCQPNGVGDVCDLADAVSRDCNENNIPDECDGIATPSAPLPEPGGVTMNRYLALLPGNSGELSAIRLTLSALHEPDPPNLFTNPPPDFSAFDGQVRWVGPPMLCPDETSFWCAKLQCTPHYEDWESIIGLAALYVTGAEVTPSSHYNVQTITTGCNEVLEASYSGSLALQTARWGDVHPPFQLPSPNSLTQPNVIDIGVVVDKVKGLVGAIPKVRAQLKTNDPDPFAAVNVIEIGYTVDALKGFAYPFTGPESCP